MFTRKCMFVLTAICNVAWSICMFLLRLLLLLPWLIWRNFFCYGFTIIFSFCLESKRVMVRWALSGRFRAFKQFKCFCFFFTVTFWLMPEVLCFFESILSNNSSLIWHIFVIKSSNIAISLFFCTFLLCFLYWKLETLRVITSDSAVLTNRRLHFQVLKGQHFYFSLSSKFCQNDSGQMLWCNNCFLKKFIRSIAVLLPFPKFAVFIFEVTWRMEHLRCFFFSRMEMNQAWVYKRHYSLHRNDFPVTQWLVLGSVLVSTSFRFGGFG